VPVDEKAALKWYSAAAAEEGDCEEWLEAKSYVESRMGREPKWSARKHGTGFFSGLWLMVTSSVAAYLAGAISQKDASEAIICLWILSGLGFLISLVTVRNAEWAQFMSDAGIIALNVTRAGKEKDKFDSFVDTLRNQIRIARDKVLKMHS